MQANRALITEYYGGHRERWLRYFVCAGIDMDDSQDLVQEVFVRLLEYAHPICPASLANLAYTIAKRLRYDYYRRYAVRHDAETQLAVLYGSQQAASVLPDEVLERREVRHLYVSSVRALPEARRRIFLMTVEEEMGNMKVAERLGVSIKTVNNQLWQARQTLRQCLAIACG